MTDWEQHLQKQERRQKKYKKVFWLIIFSFLVAMLAQTVAGLMPELDEDVAALSAPYSPRIYWDSNAPGLQITCIGTTADAIEITNHGTWVSGVNNADDTIADTIAIIESEDCLTYGLAAVEWMAADKIMQQSEDCNE